MQLLENDLMYKLEKIQETYSIDEDIIDNQIYSCGCFHICTSCSGRCGGNCTGSCGGRCGSCGRLCEGSC